ncbi:MAG: L-seryl-tRNA(Sec) selenium transferase [Candidatus Marinimicrobia bacterium]|nr:L-seryl-tRNA(Sec) selenium transferase [Candidatus Neomarinimicrobiota bacterium]
MSKNQFQSLPSVSEVLLELKDLNNLNNSILTYFINKEISWFRKQAKLNKLAESRSEITKKIVQKVGQFCQPSMKNIINGTGIVLHTGFGRAPIQKTRLKNVMNRLGGYSNLEFNLETGTRGNRLDHVREYCAAITGSENSLMVNNNAAAVLLALNTLAEGKEVIISRGQEVEIGGSFRIPDIVRKSNCFLKEVGTTNRTHLNDYKKAINTKTGLILWVHTSNYVVKGFTKEVSLHELVELGKKKHIPVMADLGSGALIKLSKRDLPGEIPVQDVVKSGAVVVTFSGDKLLGGPQAGIVVGKNRLLKRMELNPIYRTIRCGKFTIALMEETLRTYRSEEVTKDNLTLSLLSTKRVMLKKRGRKIIQSISTKRKSRLGIALIESTVEAGSGSLPACEIESMALRFYPKNQKISELAYRFRTGKTPVVGYISGNRFFIDLKTILPNQVAPLIDEINQV